MPYIAVKPPIKFINLTDTVGQGEANAPDDVLVVRAFMIYLSNHRKDMGRWTSTKLPSLTGTADDALLQMIKDYQMYCMRNGQFIWAEERENIKLMPHDMRLPAAPSASTIIWLNTEIRAMPGYGTSIDDVLCNLFGPLAEVLRAPQARSSGDWRDVARAGVAWNQWRDEQKQAAMSANHQIKRQFDLQIQALLAPYLPSIKAFEQSQATMKVTSSNNPSNYGEGVTFQADVTLGDGSPAVGTVTFEVTSGGIVQVQPGVGRRSGIGSARSQPTHVTLNGGRATFTLGKLPKGYSLVLAKYRSPTNTIETVADEFLQEVR